MVVIVLQNRALLLASQPEVVTWYGWFVSRKVFDKKQQEMCVLIALNEGKGFWQPFLFLDFFSCVNAGALYFCTTDV